MLTEGETDVDSKYEAVIKITVKTDDDESTISGVIENNIPKIIEIDGYEITMRPEGLMSIIKYVDLPGTIGIIGGIMGKYNVNIGEMQVGRKTEGGEAVMVLKVDQEVTDEIIVELENIEEIHSAKAIKI